MKREIQTVNWTLFPFAGIIQGIHVSRGNESNFSDWKPHVPIKGESFHVIVLERGNMVPSRNNKKITSRIRRTSSAVGWVSGCHAGGREFDSGRTNTQGLKITE